MNTEISKLQRRYRWSLLLGLLLGTALVALNLPSREAFSVQEYCVERLSQVDDSTSLSTADEKLCVNDTPAARWLFVRYISPALYREYKKTLGVAFLSLLFFLPAYGLRRRLKRLQRS